MDCLTKLFSARSNEMPPSEPTQHASSSAPERSTVAPSPSLRLLVAEDNKINQQFARALLSKAGHKVDIAENGHQAVDAVRRTEYDAVLMDIQMPELDGIEATKQIRALPSPACDVLIIAMTANAMTGARTEYLAAGMDDYISKPVDGKELLSKLAAVSAKAGHKQPPATDLARLETGEAPCASTLPTFDFTRLAELDEAMPREKVNELAALFLSDAASQLTQLEEYRVQPNLPAASRTAHTLISTAGNVGAVQMCALSRELEFACKSGHTRAADRIIRQMSAAGAQMTSALLAWLEDRKRSNAEVPVARKPFA